MEWDDVQTEAKRLGYMIFAMDQSQTPVMTQPGPWGTARLGFCAGCAVHWIVLRYAGYDFEFDQTTLEGNTPHWLTTRDQHVLDNWQSSVAFPLYLRGPFSSYDLTVNQGLVTCKPRPLTGGMLKNAGIQATGCYYIDLRGPGVGHAIAMQNSGGGKWRLFDANYGEFATARDDDFKDFVNWYAHKTGYAEQYTEATRIVGINAPPFVGRTFEANTKDLIKKFRS